MAWWDIFTRARRTPEPEPAASGPRRPPRVLAMLRRAGLLDTVDTRPPPPVGVDPVDRTRPGYAERTFIKVIGPGWGEPDA